MAYDHFVAKTYLKHFGDPSRNGMLNAYRKSDGKTFSCWPNDVCREWDGDLNPFFEVVDILGQYRKLFEQSWNAAIAALAKGTLSDTEKFQISGYLANLMTCTPTARRLGSELCGNMAARHMLFDNRMSRKYHRPAKLSADAIDALRNGTVEVRGTPDYAKSIATRNVLKTAWTVYHLDWTVMENRTDRPFVTTDHPVGMEDQGFIGSIAERFIPITPTLCVHLRIPRRRSRPGVKLASVDPTQPSRGMTTFIGAQLSEVKRVNRALVQCAEDLVFSSKSDDGIRRLIGKYSEYQIEMDFITIPESENSELHGFATRVRRRTSPAGFVTYRELHRDPLGWNADAGVYLREAQMK